MRNLALCSCVAFICVAGAAACNDTDTVEVPAALPVTIDAAVHMQVTDAIVGSQPQYTVTTFLSARQGPVAVSPSIDSIIVSYRLNDAPFVVGAPTTRPIFVGLLPFTAQRGDHYTVFARMYSHATGTGGKRGEAISDFNVAGMAVDTTQ
jgi:hypothetical protein